MSLLNVIGALLPLGVATAFSSVPVAVVIVILLSNRARTNGLAYLIGWTAGILISTTALTAGLAQIPERVASGHSTLIATTEIALGAVLFLYGLWVGRHERRQTATHERRWVKALDAAPAWTALGTGIALAFRPKALLIGIAASLTIANAALSPVPAFTAVVFYGVLGISTVAGPVIASRIQPERTVAWLHSARGILLKNGPAITMVVCIVIGATILGNGLTRF